MVQTGTRNWDACNVYEYKEKYSSQNSLVLLSLLKETAFVYTVIPKIKAFVKHLLCKLKVMCHSISQNKHKMIIVFKYFNLLKHM